MKRMGIVLLTLLVAMFLSGCIQEQGNETKKEPPGEKPQGVLVRSIKEGADIIFTSVRHVLEDLNCLDEDYELKHNFIMDPDCNAMIYAPEGGLVPARQLFTMDLETGEVIQITNMNVHFSSGQVVDATTVVTSAATSDTSGDDRINDEDDKQLYLLDLATGEMDCLTCGFGLEALNNPDYSHKREAIVFSARQGPYGRPNHLYTIDRHGNLTQLTNSQVFSDFDCSWSEDGEEIVLSRLPLPAFSAPSQVWLMDSEGKNHTKLTEGGGNPNYEEPHGFYPIGIDADPDLSPDSKEIVFSRLRTGRENEPFGVFELVIVNIKTGEETVLDSRYANMLPEWKSRGILLIRQYGGTDPMAVKQGLYLYGSKGFEQLEGFPYDVFPIGAYAASWIELG